MTIDTALTALAIVLSVVSVALSGWFSIRTARLNRQLEDERDAVRALGALSKPWIW